MFPLRAINGLLGSMREAWKFESRADRLQPYDALVFLTYRCTGQCKCCKIWKWSEKERREELGVGEWHTVIDKLREGGISGIEIFGGDTLLRKDVLFDFIEYATSKGIETYMPTNANLLDDETARLLVEKGLHTIYFSLEGTKDVHDMVRGMEGSFEKVVSAIEMIAAHKKNGSRPVIVVNPTISRLNFGNIVELVQYMKRLPVDEVEFGYLAEFTEDVIERTTVAGIKPEPFFVTTDGVSHLLSIREAREFQRLLKEVRRLRKTLPYSLRIDNLLLLTVDELASGEFPRVRCIRCAIKPTISPHGDVSPCPSFSGYTLGNLLEDDFSSIWGQDFHKEFVSAQESRRIPLCEKCNVIFFKKGIKLTIRNYLRKLLF